MKKYSVIYIIAIIIFVFLIYSFNKNALAGIVSNFSDQLSSQIISTGSNHTIRFINSSEFGPDETLELYFEQDFDLSYIDYTDIDFKANSVDYDLAATAGSGSNSPIGVTIANQTITFIQNDTNTISAQSNIEIQIGNNAKFQISGDNQIYNPSTADNYKISISGSFGDIGTISLMILNTDSVGFQAEVLPELRFSLRNADDNDTFTKCDLGSLSHLSVNQCSYRLAAETNGIKGFQVFIKSDGNLRSNNNYILNISEDNQIEAGTEAYGIAVQAANNLIEEGDFSDDDTAVPDIETLIVKSSSVYNYIESNLETSSLITHKVAISSSTSAGSYSQKIIYTIISNY